MNNTLVIGVAGGSGSGKSTFSRILKELLDSNGISTKSVSMDSYYLQEENLPLVKSPINGKEYRDYNSPLSFDLSKFHKDIYATKEREEYQVVIVEGLLTLWDNELLSHLDLKLYIDCSSDERIVRRITRNMKWGLSFEEISQVYLDLVRFRHNEFVEPSKYNADLIINGSCDFNKPCNIIFSYISDQLKRGTK